MGANDASGQGLQSALENWRQITGQVAMLKYYGSFLLLDLAHACRDELITHACARVWKHSQTHPIRAQTLYNIKGQSANILFYQYMGIWGTYYLTTMCCPTDMALVS